MKYEKNKLRLNEITTGMQSFYFLVKFNLVLIYTWKVYRKILFDLIEKKYAQFITGIFLLKIIKDFWKISMLKIWKLLPTFHLRSVYLGVVFLLYT